jgi:hypothetical protein
MLANAREENKKKDSSDPMISACPPSIKQKN